ncbi:MAG TPA: hypothetical protein VLH18_08085 [Candidatus Limnocylindrales bacterium]|nr:hypothetical protein [Candidatus Limnocylindrales bacterium]
MENNIIVYKIESADDNFLKILFGLPYSEWSVRPIFTWHDQRLVFLREEEVF